MKVKVQLPKSVDKILDKFSRSGYEIYIVGGAVRDLILGKIVEDWDFTTNATPDEILKTIKGGLYNNKYGTVFSPNPDDPEKPHEITTYRKEEKYKDARHPESLVWGKTLDEDLSRRDFTINAMALKTTKKNIQEYELIDKFEGKKDLDKRIIRTVGNPNERFSEDALRMMRAIRIAAELGFTIEEKTLNAIKQNASLINRIAKERIKEELFKLLSSPHPYQGILMFKNSGLMSEIIPELEKTFGVNQKSPGRHHIYDVGTHLLMSLKSCKSKNPIVRFATLVHDIGKPQTYKVQENGITTFYNHEIVSTKIAENIAERLRFSKKEKDKFIKLVRFHQFTLDEKQTDSSIRRFIKNVGKENIKDMLDLRVADRLGGGAKETSWRLEEFKKRLIEIQKQPFTVKDLKIDGEDVMKTLHIKSGPEVGKILDKIYEEVVSKKVPNEKGVLLSELKNLK